MATSTRMSGTSLPPHQGAQPRPWLRFSSLRWRKTLRDLAASKTQTVLVILSIAVGIFAFGMIATARATLLTRLPVAYTAVNPASATLHTAPLDDDAIESVARMPEIALAEGRYAAGVRYRDRDGTWHDMQLFALPDYTDSRINIIEPVSGPWPPTDRTLTVERNSLFLTGAKMGDTLHLRLPNGVERDLPVMGLLHDMNQPPAQVTGIPNAYISRDTLDWLGLPSDFNELHIVVAEHADDKAHITAVTEQVEDRLNDTGHAVFWSKIPNPGEHFVMDFLPAIVVILSILGLLALLLSGFLVINVITAVLMQQTRQIGIMKIIGARRRDLIGLYLRMMILVGVCATLIAVPLSLLAGQQFSRFIAAQLNFDLQGLTVYPNIIGAQLFVGVLVPILAALYPVVHAADTTVREAIQDYGLGNGEFGDHGIDRLILSLQEHLPLSRPLRISIRNTFRRKGRLARTVITLMLASAIFMAVLAVRASLFNTLEDTLSEQGFDVQIQLVYPQRTERLMRELAPIEGVTAVESWSFSQGVPLHADGSEGEIVVIYALPVNTRILTPNLMDGRWLSPGEENAVVVGSGLLNDEPGTALGGPLTLRIGDQDLTWTVVGVNEAFQSPIAPTVLYVSQADFARRLGQLDHTDTVRIITADSDPATHARVSREALERLQAAGMDVRSTRTGSEDRVIFGERFNIMTTILMTMAFLLALVGGLGLMGTMTINVIERRREIGVMRAIGAGDRAVLRIVMSEALTIALLAWLGGMVLSVPLSALISYTVGMAFLQLPLHYAYNPLAPLLWLVIVLTIATIASALPARQATRLSVHETIAYE